MIPEKDEYPMEQLRCPRCGGRLLDIGTDSPGKVEITTKCPKCNNLVTAVWEPKKNNAYIRAAGNAENPAAFLLQNCIGNKNRAILYNMDGKYWKHVSPAYGKRGKEAI